LLIVIGASLVSYSGVGKPKPPASAPAVNHRGQSD